MKSDTPRRPQGGTMALVLALVFVVWAAAQIANGNNTLAAVSVVVFFVGIIPAYFAPALIARHYKHPAQNGIALVNFFLGWTVIGWVAALIWAYTFPTSADAAAEPVDTRTCPFCAEAIKPAAIKCKHCGSDLPSDSAGATP